MWGPGWNEKGRSEPTPEQRYVAVAVEWTLNRMKVTYTLDQLRGTIADILNMMDQDPVFFEFVKERLSQSTGRKEKAYQMEMRSVSEIMFLALKLKKDLRILGEKVEKVKSKAESHEAASWLTDADHHLRSVYTELTQVIEHIENAERSEV